MTRGGKFSIVGKTVAGLGRILFFRGLLGNICSQPGAEQRIDRHAINLRVRLTEGHKDSVDANHSAKMQSIHIRTEADRALTSRQPVSTVVAPTIFGSVPNKDLQRLRFHRRSDEATAPGR